MMSSSATKAKRAGKEKKDIAGFLLKLYDICCNNDLKKIIDYGANGDTIIVKNVEKFTEEVLPRYFRHNKYQSFVRQLNMYDFHKTMANPKDGEFKHKNFLKGRIDLLPLIKRKEKKIDRLVNNEEDEDDDEDDENNVDLGFVDDESPMLSLDSTLNSNLSSVGNGSRQMSNSPGAPHLYNGSLLGSSSVDDQKRLLKMEKISICNELRKQRTVTDQVLQQIAQIEDQNCQLAQMNSSLVTSITETQRKQEQIHRRLENVLKALYIAQYSTAGIQQPPDDSNRPSKLIQSITTTGAIPAKLSDGQVKWIEDYANSLVKTAMVAEPSPRSPRYDEDMLGPLGPDLDLFRVPSFDEMIKGIPGSNMPLLRTHSLFDENLSENNNASAGNYFYPSYGTSSFAPGIYGSGLFANPYGGMPISSSISSSNSNGGKYGGSQKPPKSNPSAGPTGRHLSRIQEAIDMPSSSSSDNAPRKVGRPRKTPAPGSLELPPGTTIEKLSSGKGKRGRPPRNSDNSSVNSSVSSGDSNNSKRGRSGVDSDGDVTLDGDNEDEDDNNPSWLGEKSTAELVDTLNKESELTLNRVNSLESTFLSVVSSGEYSPVAGASIFRTDSIADI